MIEYILYLRLFPKDSDEVIDYSGARTVEALSVFIESNGKDDGKSASTAQGEEAEEDDEEAALHEDL